MAGELGRLSRIVGKEGKLGQRLNLGKVDGFWEESVESVNELIDDLSRAGPVHATCQAPRRSRALTSRVSVAGGLPKKRAYSRLNCEGLS